MLELGKVQKLEIKRIKDIGVFLGEKEDSVHSVLLPKKQVPEGAKTGDEISVFLYRDSSDRLIATTAAPALQIGETALLKVKEVAKIGAFLDMGLEKDLLLPFKEQTHPVKAGEDCLVALYEDRSKRLAATMQVYHYMNADSPYKEDDKVTGTIYEIKPMGAFVAVDNKYFGLIPPGEMYEKMYEGETISARVVRVREDGKLDLSPREKAYLQMDADAEKILSLLDESEGVLKFTDKADPELIKKELGLSKAAFKRAVGRLLKNGVIKITDTTIEKIK